MKSFPFHLGEASISFIYIFLPLLLGYVHTRFRPGKNKSEIYLFYTIFIGVGIQGLLTGVVQIFKPETVAKIVDWPASPFIPELGMANLSFGILAMLSLWINSWRTPAALGYGLFLFFTGLGHVIEIFQKGITAGNAQTFLYSDLLVPVCLFTFMMQNRSKKTIGW